MKNIFFIVMLICASASSAQIITTIAGTNVGAGYTGDGGPAIAANIGAVGFITVDNHNNYYFSENNNTIRKVSSSGIITLVAGTGVAGFGGDTGPATAAQINRGIGVATDSAGNLYIADENNNRIRKVDAATGIITTLAGNGIAGYSGDGGAAATASLNAPYGICVDVLGNLYFSDLLNFKIRKIDLSGIITTVAGNGTNGFSGDTGPATSAQLSAIYGLRTDSSGNLYITDNNRIREINITTGIINTIIGTGVNGYSGDMGPATAAELWLPDDVVIDNQGNILISDMDNNRIRKVDATGIITTIVGNGVAGFLGDGGGAATSEVSSTRGICVDNCGNLYIADNGNGRIRKVTYPPIPITLTNSITTLTDTACASTPITYTAATTASSGTVTYQWYVNGTPITGATSSTYTYTPADADSIRCIATATSPCTSAVTSSNIIIMSVTPITTPTITVTAPAAAAVGTTVTVSAVVAGAGSGYSIHWYNNSALFSTTTAPTTTYTKAPGTDHITATVVPPTEGCYDSTTSAISTVTASTTGVRNTSLSFGEGRGEVIYPNPVKDLLYVDDVRTQVVYKIRSVVGSAVMQGTLQQGTNTIDVKELPAGVYMMEVVYPSGLRATNKIIKQ